MEKFLNNQLWFKALLLIQYKWALLWIKNLFDIMELSRYKKLYGWVDTKNQNQWKQICLVIKAENKPNKLWTKSAVKIHKEYAEKNYFFLLKWSKRFTLENTFYIIYFLNGWRATIGQNKLKIIYESKPLSMFYFSTHDSFVLILVCCGKILMLVPFKCFIRLLSI